MGCSVFAQTPVRARNKSFLRSFFSKKRPPPPAGELQNFTVEGDVGDVCNGQGVAICHSDTDISEFGIGHIVQTNAATLQLLLFGEHNCFRANIGVDDGFHRKSIYSQVTNGAFGQTDDIHGGYFGIAYDHVTDADVLDDGGILCEGHGVEGEQLLVGTVGAAAIEEVDGEGRVDVGHEQITEHQVAHCAAALSAGLDTHTAIGAVENAVGDRNISHTARHFASDDHAAVTVEQGTVGDGDIFAGELLLQGIVFGSRFEGNAVIAYVYRAVRDTDIATAFGVDAVGVGGVGGILDGDSVNDYIVAAGGDDRPRGGIFDGDILDLDIIAKDRLDASGAAVVLGDSFPPIVAASVDGAAAGDHDVSCSNG